jgi:uncharacterized protein (TIGR02271 family)
MAAENLVAVYPSYSHAEQARTRLMDAGVPASDIRLSAPSGGAETARAEPAREGDFWSWLFGDAPEEDRSWYHSNLREGRTALSVHVRAEDSPRIRGILEELDPIDVDEEVAAGTATGVSGEAETQVGTAASPRAAGEGEEVIPVVREELQVGKRAVERRVRVRAYVVERPVEAQVPLRDERIVIERRPVGDAGSVGAEGPQERDVEVVERHEEPVVAKQARAEEEVVVHKEAAERVETVRENVRETRVDVDQRAAASSDQAALDRAAAGDKPSTAAGPAERAQPGLGEGAADKLRGIKEDAKDALSPDRKP